VAESFYTQKRARRCDYRGHRKDFELGDARKFSGEMCWRAARRFGRLGRRVGYPGGRIGYPGGRVGYPEDVLDSRGVLDVVRSASDVPTGDLPWGTLCASSKFFSSGF